MLALIGVLVVIAGALMLALLPYTLAGERAYREAPPCPEGETRSRECRSQFPATVAAKVTDGEGRSKNWFVSLRFADGSEQRVQVPSGRSVFEVLDVGEPVTVTAWRGQIREFSAGPDQVRASASPAGRFKGPLMVGLFALPLGSSLLWASHCVRSARRTGRTLQSAGV
ncbi:hypothetical protein ACFQ07_14680, partial [Actinomadura adrarensis]